MNSILVFLLVVFFVVLIVGGFLSIRDHMKMSAGLKRYHESMSRPGFKYIGESIRRGDDR